MNPPMDWLPDGTPYSPRFGDRYHSEQPLAQAREVFLHGCGLPGAWAGAAQWRILETGFGLGQNFLATWDAWRADPDRPRLLHFVSLEAWPVSSTDLLRAATRYPELLPLAEQLAAQVTRRDAKDSSVVNFTKAASGVVTLDSSDLDFDQTVAAALVIVTKVLNRD